MKRLALILLLPIIASPASAADPICFPVDQAESYMLAKYGEVMRGVGSSEIGATAIFVDPKTHEWSVVQGGKDGRACIVDYGTGWELGGDPA